MCITINPILIQMTLCLEIVKSVLSVISNKFTDYIFIKKKFEFVNCNNNMNYLTLKSLSKVAIK